VFFYNSKKHNIYVCVFYNSKKHSIYGSVFYNGKLHNIYGRIFYNGKLHSLLMAMFFITIITKKYIVLSCGCFYNNHKKNTTSFCKWLCFLFN